MENRLFYNTPAKCFEEALPLGNGAFGGMVYGNIQNEKISLNLDTLWNGKPETEPQEDKTEHLKVIQQLHREGKPEEADRYLEENFASKQSRAYLPMGSLFIENDGVYEGEYLRSLDLENSIATTEISGKNSVKYEFLFSYPHFCGAVKISSASPCNLKLHFECVHNHIQSFTDGIFTVKGAAEDKKFGETSIVGSGSLDDSEKTVKFTFSSGFICDKSPAYDNGVITFENVTELVIFMTANTTFVDAYTLCPLAECTEKTLKQLKSVLSLGYDAVKKAHTADVSELYNRTLLNLVDAPSETDTLIRIYNSEGDIGLCELLFNYAKYLTIASSRKGSQAMNLQGIWNEHEKAPWSSNYTVNINTE